jgi:hypothetical protein
MSMRLKLWRRRNIARLRILDLMKPGVIQGYGVNLLRSRIVNNTEKLSYEIDKDNYERTQEFIAHKIEEALANGVCPVHGKECPDIQAATRKELH